MGLEHKGANYDDVQENAVTCGGLSVLAAEAPRLPQASKLRVLWA